MNYTSYDMGSYHLYVIPTDRFKRTVIEFNFKKQIEKEDISYLNFLMAVLMEGCKKYPTKRTMELASDDLYGMGWSYQTMKSGNYFILKMSFVFLNEKYTEEGMLEKSLEMIHDILFDPDIENGSFKKEKVELVRTSHLENLRTFWENQLGYANLRMLEAMAPDSSISYHPYGEKELVEAIDGKDLYQYYQKLMKSYLLDIVVCGEIEGINYAQILRKLIPINTLKHPGGSHFIPQKEFRKRSKTIIETKDFNQSKLVIGCKVEPLTSFENQYVMPIYNYLLGGSMDSILFQVVREKHSLCYTIQSSFQASVGILKIFAGIEKDDFKKAMKLIKESMKKLEKGNFTEEQIQNGILTYISAYQEITDSPENMIGSLMSHLYFDSDLRDQKLEKIKTVTKNDLLKVAKKVHMDTVYLLEGVVQNENNEA